MSGQESKRLKTNVFSSDDENVCYFLWAGRGGLGPHGQVFGAERLSPPPVEVADISSAMRPSIGGAIDRGPAGPL